MMLMVSILVFIITELQPGDFASQYINNPRVSPEQIELIKERLGLDESPARRYFLWMKNIITKLDFGYSFSFKRPVSELIGERMGWTVLIAVLAIIVQWSVAVPLGIYSALHPYSKSDMVLTFASFIGVSMPGFFFAIIIMFLLSKLGFASVGGLLSPEFIGSSLFYGTPLGSTQAYLGAGTGGFTGGNCRADADHEGQYARYCQRSVCNGLAGQGYR